MSKLELSKTVMYEFWCDYLKLKYSGKLCYMNTESFIAYIKALHAYKGIAEDVEIRFYTSNYELDRPLTKGENKKLIGIMKND